MIKLVDNLRTYSFAGLAILTVAQANVQQVQEVAELRHENTVQWQQPTRPEVPIDDLYEELEAKARAEEEVEESADTSESAINGDPPVDPDHAFEVAAARASYDNALGEANAAQQGLAAAQQQLASAQRAENQLAHAPATDGAMTAARLATANAQAETWAAQNQVAMADGNRQAAEQWLADLGEPVTGSQTAPNTTQGSTTAQGSNPSQAPTTSEAQSSTTTPGTQAAGQAATATGQTHADTTSQAGAASQAGTTVKADATSGAKESSAAPATSATAQATTATGQTHTDTTPQAGVAPTHESGPAPETGPAPQTGPAPESGPKADSGPAPDNGPKADSGPSNSGPSPDVDPHVS